MGWLVTGTVLRERPLTTHLAEERFGFSPASNWTARVASVAEFRFISQICPSKIKYQVLPFFLTLNKYVQNMNNVRYKTTRLLKKTSMYRSRYVYDRHYLPTAVCLT